MTESAHPVFWEGSFGACHSFDIINRACASRLAADPRFDLTIVQTHPPQPGVEPPGLEDLLAHDLRKKPLNLRKLKAAESTWISHGWPPRSQRPPHSSRWILFLPWEYTRVPIRVVEALQQADEIWTTSEFSRQAFQNSGIAADRISVIPLGVEPSLYHRSQEAPPLALPTEKSFRFLFVGGTIHRKGIDLLLDAYGTVFGPNDEVTLVIKEMGHPTLYANQSARERIEEFQADEDAPELLYLTEFFAEEKMHALYRACDLVVLPYRGEGFCLPALEAAACRVPAIVTRGGPTDEFLPEGSHWKLSADLRSIGPSVYGMPCAGEAAFLEPDRSELERLLREAPQEISQIRGPMADLSETVLTTQTWDRTAQTLCDLLLPPGESASPRKPRNPN